MIRANLIIKGRVQGVGYRANVRRMANKFNLRGWARNLRNGDVELLVEGSDAEVDRIIAWCHRGPTSAYVLKVNVEKTLATGEFDGFRIKSTL
jgi:acylphosphatase